MKSIFSSSDIAARFRSGLFWNVVSAGLTQGSALLANIIIARILGKEVFGEFSLVQSTLLTFAGIAQVATGMMATKFVAEYRSVNKLLTGRILGLCSWVTFITGCVATLIIIFSASWVAESVWVAPQLSKGLWLASAFVLFSVMNGYQMGALAGLESYKALSVVGAIQGVLHLVLCAWFVLNWGLYGVLTAFSISAFLRWSVTSWILKKEASRQGIAVSRSLDVFKENRLLFHFALPAAITGLSSMPAIWLGNTLLARQTGGYAELGGYNAANNLRVLMLMLPILLNNVGMALINDKFGTKDSAGYWGIFRVNMITTAALSISGAVAMVVLGNWVMSWYGNGFVTGYDTVLIVLALAIVPEALSIAAYQLIQSQGRMWISFFAVALPRDLLMVLLAYWLIPIWKGVGLAMAYSISWLLAFLLIVAIVKQLGLHRTKI